MTRVLATLLISFTLCSTLLGGENSGSAVETMDQKTDALADRWRERFAEEKFNFLTSAPFLLAGNGTPDQLKKYRDDTVSPAARALSAQFFKTPPDQPILILLFESEGPYKRLAKKWFGEEDVPHFGFYRHHDRAMLVNVSTGLGTLVHEMTHALIAPDFPKVPDWFNEGIASLFEQSRFSPDGKSIQGLPNWRLPALQREIQNETIRPLAELMADDKFREVKRVGLNYAQARYLMLYLQEKQLLQKYYAMFRDNHKADPTGLQTLQKLVLPKKWDQFEEEWQNWVMTLRAP